MLSAIAVDCRASTNSQDAVRPNILWIIAEDMGPELGYLGTPEVRTPAIDALAGNGMRYDNAFTVTPVCSTSRSSFMTGMYAMAIDAHNHRSHRDGTNPLPDGVRVLTDWLRPHGYWTGNIVKLTDDATGSKFYKGTGKTDWNFQRVQPPTGTDSKNSPIKKQPFDTRNWDDLKSHQPFYAQINFSETHRGFAWNTAHEHIEHPADPEKVVIPPYYPDHVVTRAVWAQYLNAVMAVDKKVAFIRKLLKRDNLEKNTIVIFMTDHGRAMPRGKQWPYDSGLKIPVVIYWPEGNPDLPPPNGYERGSVNQQLISSIDLAASTLAFAGVKKPSKMQGRVLLGETREPPRDIVFGGRDRGDETVFHVRTARDDRFRYIRNKYPGRPFLQMNAYKETSYPIIGLMRNLHKEGKLSGPAAMLVADSRPAEELYDLSKDPWEINNLADDPDYADEKSKLSKAIDDWMERINDRGRMPESAETVEFWRKKMEANYATKMSQRSDDWYLSHQSLGPHRETSNRTLPIKFKENFENGTENWEVLDPKTWKLKKVENNTTFEITERKSEYKPPVRSPGHIALIKDIEVGDFDLTFRVRSTKDTGNHRDCCVFFGYQDDQHFYYVHLGAKPDPHSGQIMIVKEAPRKAMTQNEKLVPWDNEWHDVKVERRLEAGTINVYFDDMATPHMSVRDKTFGPGLVGIGSFDDLNEFDDVVLRAE